MTVAVNVICRNLHEDRVIPRFARYLADANGWNVTARPVPNACAYYLSGYFEAQLLKQWPETPTAAYFTHREEVPVNGAKARLFDSVGARVDLRIVTADMYQTLLLEHGPTIQINPPVERHRFTIPDRRVNSKPVAGFSGYTYGNGRKGENLARKLVDAYPRREWRASGRGWPVPTKRYAWADMPGFYQSLDVLVITALVEGVPMPPLEALACGVSVVVPREVGLLDELPDVLGIHRYERGNATDIMRAFDEAIRARPDVDREALRAVTKPYNIANWCEQHRMVFEEMMDLETPVLEQTLLAEDDEIIDEVRQSYADVEAVLSWTRKRIPASKQQIMPYQGAVLAYYANQYNRPGARFLEIGSAIGYSACLLATAAPQAQITTLNPQDGEFERARDNLRIRANVEVMKHSSQEYWSSHNGQLYDLVFVDGDHAYDMVLHDAQFFNCLAPGGLILFHDYSPEGSAHPSAGSYRALNDLQQRRRTADVLVVGTGDVGMLGWIRKEGETWD